MELERESEKWVMGTFIENWLKDWSRISLGSNCYEHLEVESMRIFYMSEIRYLLVATNHFLLYKKTHLVS